MALGRIRLTAAARRARSMPRKTVTVLLVEDDPVAAGLFHAQLHADIGVRFEFELADSLEKALELLREKPLDVVVLDLMLPDSEGIESLETIRAEAGPLPIVVLTGLDDEEVAVRAVERGAQDYLVKGEISGRMISRSLLYAIERQRLLEALRGLSLLDDLTGLYNRRGFLTLAEQQLGLARRMGRGVALVFADVDGFKEINDTHGHRAGDRALRRVARALRDTFRGSDVVARFGGDEFIVLAPQPSRTSIDGCVGRLESNLAAAARATEPGTRLSLSLGIEWCDSGDERPLAELISEADRRLYEEKRRKSEAADRPVAPSRHGDR